MIATVPAVGRDPEPRFFAAAGAFRAWLEVHHATAAELLVGFHERVAVILDRAIDQVAQGDRSPSRRITHPGSALSPSNPPCAEAGIRNAQSRDY